jgi:pyruvate,water dikinase
MKTLDEIRPADAPRVGGKAFNCARLKQAGMPVPDGIVVMTDAMGASLEIPRLRQWLADLPPGALLAVRSSATGEDSVGHSFAGIHETTLNVAPVDVPDAIRSCWKSVTSPQAVAYRQSQKLPTDNAKTAVLIQRMIQPLMSGVAFTSNPISGQRDEILINSIFGLGEAMVAGRVEPDEFRIRKTDAQVLSSTIAGSKPSLTDEQLHKLTKLLLKIEGHYGAGQDVEWCHDGSQFWIVQSRPITTTGASHGNDLEWTRANAREVLPELPTPMTAYPVAEVIEEAERKFYGALLAPEAELGPMVKVFFGRMYFNLDQIRYTCKLTGTVPAAILRSLGHEGEIAPEDKILQRTSLKDVMHAVPDLLRVGWYQLTISRLVRQHAAGTEDYLRGILSRDFRTLNDRDLWAENRKWRAYIVNELQLVFALAGVMAYERPLESICKRVGTPYERLAYSHLAAGEKSVSSAQAFDLLRLAKNARSEPRASNYFSKTRDSFSDWREALRETAFLNEFEAFLQRYGHRGRYESEIASPRYAEDPTLLLFAIHSHVRAAAFSDPDEIVRRQEHDAAKAWMEFHSKLHWWQRWLVAPQARWLLRRIKQFYVWRERCRSDLVRTTMPMRLLHLEMARRFVERGWIPSRDDYFYLIPDDVDAVVVRPESGPSLMSVIAARKAEWERYAKIQMPLLIKESQLPGIARRFTLSGPEGDVANQLRGLCVSAGEAEGEVIVLRDPAEFARMKHGAILVTIATDPSWTPLFTLAAGVIVEIGGVLSHASTIARECGLPAIANLKNATRILKDGDRVRLDATNGIVHVLPSKT